MTITEELRKAIKESGLSLYRIAKDAGLDYPSVHRFVNSGADIRLSTADSLAKALGLELSRPKRKKAS